MKKKSDTVIRENGKLLRQARGIFGDIVTQAWITSYHYEHMAKVDTEKMLDETAKRLAETAKRMQEKGHKDNLVYDTDTIILEFNKTRTVMFTGSEWAAMGKVDITDYRVM